jgi:hypothetical protein
MKRSLLLASILFFFAKAYSQEIIVNPDGTHSVSTGSVIVNSDGTHSIRTGSVIVNSNGTHSTVHGNVIVNPNGTHSIITGNTVSPDGTQSINNSSSIFGTKNKVSADYDKYPFGIFSLIFPPKKKVKIANPETKPVQQEEKVESNTEPDLK